MEATVFRFNDQDVSEDLEQTSINEQLKDNKFGNMVTDAEAYFTVDKEEDNQNMPYLEIENLDKSGQYSNKQSQKSYVSGVPSS